LGGWRRAEKGFRRGNCESHREMTGEMGMDGRR